MLQQFSITSFRGIDTIKLTLWMKTYIQWANGSGKTHILDGIHILSGSRPLYGNPNIDIGSVFDGVFSQEAFSKSYRLVQDDMRSIFAIQWSTLSKPKYMLALPWRTVHISPFDMNLLYFAPSIRRDAMDTTLARVYEQFAKIKKEYEGVMRQRNALLKKIREGISKEDELDFWDDTFAWLCELYALYRTRYVEYIRWALIRFPIFFSRYPITFDYISSVLSHWDIHASSQPTQRDIVRQYLAQNRKRDIITGHTHIWPHRDDWGFFIQKEEESIPAELYLSRWEMKMLLLGLKLIEAEFIHTILDTAVIILIDDIFAELDDHNSELFLDSLIPYQCILTSQKSLPNTEKYDDFICINLEYS